MPKSQKHDPKRLYRSEDNKMIAGVAGGLAEYFDIDPTLMRVIFLVILFASAGMAFALYLVLAILIPKKSELEEGEEAKNKEKQDAKDNAKEKNRQEPSDTRMLFAFVLILLGFIFFFNQLFPHHFGFEFFWPLVIIAVGVALILKK